jgi:hypothetical protein
MSLQRCARRLARDPRLGGCRRANRLLARKFGDEMAERDITGHICARAFITCVTDGSRISRREPLCSAKPRSSTRRVRDPQHIHSRSSSCVRGKRGRGDGELREGASFCALARGRLLSRVHRSGYPPARTSQCSASGCLRVGGGKARSSSARSAADSRMSSALRFSRT